jgi:hypothetical protein
MQPRCADSPRAGAVAAGGRRRRRPRTVGYHCRWWADVAVEGGASRRPGGTATPTVATVASLCAVAPICYS